LTTVLYVTMSGATPWRPISSRMHGIRADPPFRAHASTRALKVTTVNSSPSASISVYTAQTASKRFWRENPFSTEPYITEFISGRVCAFERSSVRRS